MAEAPRLIGIAGCSGSGKTCLAKALAERLGAEVISLDSYYHPLDHLPLAEREIVNFDHPDSIDWQLLLAQLRQLRAGQPIDEPVYLFAKHTRAATSRQVPRSDWVIVEGILALHHPELRAIFDLKLYVDTNDDLCFARRLERDVEERGRTPESVRMQYQRTVRPMADCFVHPSRQWADIVVSGVAPFAESVDRVLALYPVGISSELSPNL